MIHFYLHSYGEHDEKNKIGPCTWPHFDLLFVHEGEILLRFLKRDQLRLTSNQGVLIYPLTHFQGYSVSPLSKTSVQHFNIDEEAPNLPIVFQHLVGKKQGYEAYKGDYSDSLFYNIDLTIRWASHDQDPFLHDLRTASMTLIFGELKSNLFQKRKTSHHELAIEQLITQLRENWQAHSMNVDQMATEVGLSTSHFRSLFKEYVGTSPGRFLFNLRMLEAKRYLRETVIPIKEISERLGYNNLSHFYRAFKTHEGKSPKEYRRQNIIRG